MPTPRALALAYGAGVALFALYTATLALTEHHAILREDDWRLFADLFARGPAQSILDSHVGHRLPVTLFLMYVDYLFLGGHMHLPVVASLLCSFAAIAALWLGARASRDRGDPVVLGVLAFSAFLFFWSHSALVFRWGVMQGNPQAALFVFLAASALALYAARRDAAAGNAPLRLLLLALLSAAAATFSHGAGFAGWGALLAMSLVARLPLRVTLAIAAAAAPTLWLYSAGLSDDPGVALPRSLARIGRDPLDLLGFAAGIIGNAAGWVAAGLGLVDTADRYEFSVGAGAVGVAAAGAIGATLLAHPERARGRALMGFGLMASIAGVGLVIAALRLAHFGVEQSVAMRFLSWSAVFWIGLVLAAPVPRPGGSRGPRAVAAIGLLALCSALALPSLRLFESRAARDRVTAEQVALQLLLGIRHDRSARRLSILNAAVVYRAAEHLRGSGRNLFADPRGALPGEAFAEHFVPLARGRCKGAILEAHPLPGSRPRAVQWSGWARDGQAGEPPRHVVITDEGGVIRGLGSFDARHREGGNWFGYIARPQRSGTYAAWAVLADGRSACPVGEAISPVPRLHRSPE